MFLALWLLGACAVFDAFEPDGPRDVVITYTGPTEINVGDRAAIAVMVLLDGAVVQAPRLRMSIANPSVLELVSTGDSIVGLKPGNSDLTIALAHSIFTGPPPDTTISIRVRQVGGPGP